jgi:hypothetical protein
MRDRADGSCGEFVLDYREPLAQPRAKHLIAPSIVLSRNLGYSDFYTLKARHGHLPASYVADENRQSSPRFEAVSEDGPAAVIAGVP